jgi:hypothetical protein
VIAVSQSFGNPGRAGSFGVECVPLPLTPGPRNAEPDLGVNRRAVRSPIQLTGQRSQPVPAAAGARTTWRQAIATVEQVLDRGETDAPTIAKRIGVKLDTLYQSLQRYERDDLWKRMTNRARTKPSRSQGRQLDWSKTVPLIEELLDQGVTDAAVIADTLGILPSGVFNGLKRQDRRDLWAQMTNRGAARHTQTFTQSTRRPRKATTSMAEKKRRIAVEVRAVKDPNGDPGVLIQLPPDTSWVVVAAADARRIAGKLLDVADELFERGDE